MRVTDLTHTIRADMPVYPGTGQPELTDAFTYEKNGFREKKICMYSHNGTHMDAPAHMLPEGKCLDDFDAGYFAGEAFLIDMEDIYGKNQLEIGLESIKPFEIQIGKAEFVIIKTGWSKYWGDPRYFRNFPYLGDDAARWLSCFTLKGVGIDAISVDRSDSHSFPVHKILLSKNILIIENLTNLDSLNKAFTLWVLPLKSLDADGAPVRAVSLE